MTENPRKFQLKNPKALSVRPVHIAAPIDLEIGAGVGLHAIRYSQQHPQRSLIAIEKTRGKFEKLKRRAETHALENLYPIHANALDWVPNAVKAESVERCFILYPNPYPKARQANLRFPNMPFFEVLIGKIQVGGTLTLCSNKAFYMDDTRACLEGRDDLIAIEDIVIPFDFSPRTHFEKKYLLREETCFQLTLKKVGPQRESH